MEGFQRAEEPELEELLATQNNLKRYIEGGLCVAFVVPVWTPDLEPEACGIGFVLQMPK